MSFMTKIFGGKIATVTSTMIRAEIARAEGESNTLRLKLRDQTASVALLSDDEHIKVEVDIAATRRAIARLDARLAHLNGELPRVIEAETAADKVTADTALAARAEAAREANTKDAAKLLKDYDKLAAQVGDIIARLAEIDAETNTVNSELRRNPVAKSVVRYDTLHRKTPDQSASEVRAMRPHWIYRDAPPLPNEIAASIREEAVLATLDGSGKPVRPGTVRRNRFGGIIQPQLEMREVVVERTAFRSGNYVAPLSAIHLPPGFAGGTSHWPRVG